MSPEIEEKTETGGAQAPKSTGGDRQGPGGMLDHVNSDGLHSNTF